MQISELRKERVFVSIFLFLVCLVMARAVHAGWFETATNTRLHPPPVGTPYTPLFDRPSHLPDAYRVLMPALGRFVMKTFHIPDAPAVAALFDFINGFGACYLFYRVTVDALSETRLAAALFLAMIQFGLYYIVPWQRPETTPSALYLAICLFSFTRLRTNSNWVFPIVTATILQDFIRTDIPLVLGVSVMVLGSLPTAPKTFGSRRHMLLLGSALICLTVSAQAYLSYVRFPNLHRWPVDNQIVTLKTNLLNAHSLSSGLVALFPFVLFAIYIARTRPSLDASDRLIMIASGLYLVVWLCAGHLSEIRIFVPFMIALSSVIAKVLGSAQTDDGIH
ncbi:hypothetical protein [Tunturiibacter psychrotolerans]|uniref:hypothetical protein n=1 Tax=Tunturiibacter psychrotolerans TaxID=3069686 RepID=UPI003D1A80DC